MNLTKPIKDQEPLDWKRTYCLDATTDYGLTGKLRKDYCSSSLLIRPKGSRSEGGPDRDRSNWLIIDGSNSGSKNINDLLDRER